MIKSTASHDEQSRFDTALNDPDRLLLDSLRRDEQRRRRRRFALVGVSIGGLIMIGAFTAVLAGWLTLATTPAESTPPAALDHEARLEKADALAAEGWQLWQQRKLAEAARKFEESIALDPVSANAWNGLGWARFNGGDSEQALVAFENCVELEPTHPAGLNGLGQIYLMWRDYDKAEKFLLKAAPQAPASWFGLSRLYLLTGQFDEARKWIEKTIQTQSGDPTIPKMLAAAKEKNLPDDVRRLIEPPGKPRMSPAATLAARGWQQFNQGSMRSAERSFRRALTKDPEDASALNGLGFCLLTMGKVAEAKPNFEKCLEIDPKAAGAMNGLARCLKAEGKVDEAVEVWEAMREKFPGPNAAAVGLATTYLERGENEKALPLFEELVAAMPDNVEFKSGLEAAKSSKD